MDKFIRHIQTKEFLTEDGNWTRDIDKAWCVIDVGVAVDRIVSLGTYDVEICYGRGGAGRRKDEWQYTIPFR